jgi:hypothetical protein
VNSSDPPPGASASSLVSSYLYFYDDAAFAETDRAGFRRRVIDGEHMQLWFWRIAGGATGSILHKHDRNEQFGIVVRGALDFRIGDPESEQRHVLHAGDIYLAPTGVLHGDSLFLGDSEYRECWILDVFSPPRTDVDRPANPL